MTDTALPTVQNGAAPLAPAELSPAASGDLSTALLTLVAKSRGAQIDGAHASIDHAQEMLEWARAEVEAAMARAREAEEDAGFFSDLGDFLGGDLATIAGIVAAAAIVVATGGAGAPAILTMCAAGLSTGSAIGERLGLDPKVCAGLAGAGALLGLVTGNVTAAGSAKTIATVANVTRSASIAASGVTEIAEGEYRADSLRARADATSAQNVEGDARYRFERALDELAQAARELSRAQGATSELQRTQDQMETSVIARIGAA